jgi:arylsulfatase A-like enzyme
VASLFTSRTPVEHKVSASGDSLDRRAITLGERLSDAGYRTLGVSGNFVHVRERAGFARGFDEWKTLSLETTPGEEPLFTHMGRGLREPTAAEINAEVFARLPSAEGPSLFLYVHYMEPHSGYDPPLALRARFERDREAHAMGPEATSAYLTALARGDAVAPAGERERLIDLYDAEIASVDAEIGRLLDELERRGFARNLVVAIVSDHGEEFSEHGSWFHGLTLHGESLWVPFILHGARDTRPGSSWDEPVDLLDVPTTLLALAGVEPAPGMRGRALLDRDGVTPRTLVAALDPDPPVEDAIGPRRHRRAWARWPWKLLVDGDGRAQVFHLEHDPSESSPMALDDPRVPAELRVVAAAQAAEIGLQGDPLAPRLSEQAIRRLRALGYAR